MDTLPIHPTRSHQSRSSSLKFTCNRWWDASTAIHSQTVDVVKACAVGFGSRPSKGTPSPAPSLLLLLPRHTTTRPNNTPYTTRHSSTPPLHAPLHSPPTVLISPTQPTHPTHSSPSDSCPLPEMTKPTRSQMNTNSTQE